MSSKKRRHKNTKDKVEGRLKEAAGKTTGNQQMELKGKVQVAKAEAKGKAYAVEEKVINVEESVAEKINDKIDEKKSKK